MDFQIFHDPSGRRAVRVRTAVWFIGIAAVLAAAILLAEVLFLERRAAPSFSDFPKTEQLKSVATSDAISDSKPGAWLPAHAATPVGTGSAKAERYGFYMPWDEAGQASLAAHVGDLDWVAAGLATVHGPGHTWSFERDDHLRQILDGQGRAKLLLMIQNVDGEGHWEGRNSERLFADPAARRRFIAQIEKTVASESAAGIVLDIEDLPTSAHGGYRAFLGEIHGRFAKRGLLVTIAAPVADSTWDLAAYAAVTDRIFLMAYDEHWPGGEPGPIASQPWFAQTVAAAVKEIGPDKAIVALGNYAYDWGTGRAAPATVPQAWEKAVAAGVRPAFDPATGNSHFAYEENGVRHQVWMLDAIASWNQLQVARQLGAGGVALWRLGSEDPGFWAALAAPQGSAPQIEHLPSQDTVELIGNGEVLRLASAAQPGRREAVPGSDSLIRSASYDALPTANLVQRAGHNRRLVALTFDDGPDTRWTPQILDILKRAKAPATFFVTGVNALGEPALLRRIIDEGSELGNHSTTHADLDRLPEAAIQLELNTTQRLVESYTGRSMRLFRAPYLGDAEPSTQAELRSARVAADMGYLSVGLNVDPLDWTQTDARSIVAKTVAQVESGNAQRSTQIVLLHDSGGDRSATIAALPEIIRELRARGYDFVTVSRLAGLDRDAVMPPLKGTQQVVADGAGTLFAGLSGGGKFLGVLFLIAIALGITRAVVLTVLACRAACRHSAPNPPAHLVPSFVSVLIPAFNEEMVIETSVRRILQSQGPRVEVIVIDDGSADQTSAIVRRAFGIDPRVTLLTIENGGKARALNHGLRIAKGDVVIALDADTQFEPDTIAKLARWFADPAIGAVAGNAKIGNRINLVTRWQAVEYITAQGLERRALSALDAITVVPGAVGAWRRTALDMVGGYPADTLAEDQDLTIAIQRAGWKVACDVDAIAWTEAPETFRALFKQRYRWAFGTLQCLWKHRAALVSGQPRGLARFGMPQAWLFQIGFSLISPIIDLALVASLVDTGLRLLNHGFGAMRGDVLTILGFWSAFTAIDLACGWIAYRLDGREKHFPALRLLLQRFGYRQLLYAVVLKAVFAALGGPRVGWGKLERSGQVMMDDAAPKPEAIEAAEHIARPGIVVIPSLAA
ncbi:glycosyltransferase [Novosphingobium sp. G106]|uniref:glycosyltransferase n=1 Tax=Novosphingobium sp. G106 TaxID=2849500 RepID=UPI001C2DE636|nr:glycosyltransferase [Novosphingobium sp. G106]MBV1689391.1 glycosyltransferase [Novosphingobium sp. G106]